ncbi:Dynamin-related protein 5A [Asimina triloba]
MASATPVKTPNPKSSHSMVPISASSKRPKRNCSDSSSSDFKSRFEAYNRLQAAAVAFGERLPIPEIVALGGQSDGKSSLLEALLGFRFNVREVEMGTRRPLILQMVHDPSAYEPRCRFQATMMQDEDSEEYGSPMVSASTIADLIKQRTDSLLKKTRTAVSPKPIVMRAEYAHCPNLTIIDTPGFVLKVLLVHDMSKEARNTVCDAKKGEPENTPDEILSMVKALASPPHRLLLFLQQSSVEWCSSLWLDAIRDIDPTFRRTVIVVSKFDNRLKEFSDRWEVDRYLSASGYLGDNVHPFFVALPKDRVTVSNEEFRQQISQVDSEVIHHLREGVKGGFDEEKFRPFVGFSCLREYLESELQRRYKEAAPATLALLEERCGEIDNELADVESKLQATSDVTYLRRSAMLHAASICSHVGALIDGAADPAPEQWGKTTSEEQTESGIGNWPGVTVDIKPPNSTLKLYGGAAFERVIHEFRCATYSIECPPVSRGKVNHSVYLVVANYSGYMLACDYQGTNLLTGLLFHLQVANILLAQAGRGGGRGVTEAAAEIARAAARPWLSPLLDVACDRLAFVLRNLFEIAMERSHSHDSNGNGIVNLSNGLFIEIFFRCILIVGGFTEFDFIYVSEILNLVPFVAMYHGRGHVYLETDGRNKRDMDGYIGFHAALRRSYNNFIQDIAKQCKQLIRHHLDSATSPYSQVCYENNITGGLGANSTSIYRYQSLDAPFSLELSDGGVFHDESMNKDQENVPPKKQQQQTTPGKGIEAKARDESQMTVPETPSPDIPNGSKKENGNRIEHVGRKRQSRTTVVGGDYGTRSGSTYSDICSSAAQHFAKIREVLIERSVLSTLNSGFLTPCRDRLVSALGLDLFAVNDEKFMDMFVAPSAIDVLENERQSLHKRQKMLHAVFVDPIASRLVSLTTTGWDLLFNCSLAGPPSLHLSYKLPAGVWKRHKNAREEP